MKTLALLCSLVLLAGGEALAGKEAFRPPIITGYQPAGCTSKGARLTIQGMNLGVDQTQKKIVLTGQGQRVEAVPVSWTDTQVTVMMPDDPRVTAGRSYQFGVQDWSGNWLGNLGPLIKICEPEASPAETPAAGPAAGAAGDRARALAAAVIQASGGANWPRVRSIRFTFNVAQEGKTVVSAQHQWDGRAGADTVTWNGKTVTVNTGNPGAEADAKAAYQRWVNDSYWLLMPLKLGDPGVNLAYQDSQQIEGRRYEVLRLWFGQVGLTPGDQYTLYIDPEKHLVRRWDYQPSADKKTSGTWEGYRDFGGLNLSTEHQFGGKRIWFSDVNVETDAANPR